MDIATLSLSSLPEVATAAPSVGASKLLLSFPTNSMVVGAAWVISSAFFTTYSTSAFLRYEPSVFKQKPPFTTRISRPALLTICRFGGSLLMGLLLHPDLQLIAQRVQSTLTNIPHFTLPALFLFIANYANSISLNRIGISLTYTSKCAIPLMTVLLTVLMDGMSALPNARALLSLVPIAIGIAAASWNSPTFELIGFLAAMLSTTAQSALNVTSKKAMVKAGISGLAAQRAMVAVGFGLSVLMAVFGRLKEQLAAGSKSQSRRTPLAAQADIPPPWLTLMAVAAYHLEYMLSFMFVKLVQPITYGACDSMRRLTIILAGRTMFGGHPFSTVNLLGIALALIGALSYSIANSL
jgi:hypothetical protein